MKVSWKQTKVTATEYGDYLGLGVLISNGPEPG